MAHLMAPTGEIGRRLRAVRIRRGWKQDDVAAALVRLAVDLDEPAPGADVHLVYKWEAGTRTPGRYYRPRLLLALELEPEELGLEPTPRLLADLEELRRRLVAQTRHPEIAGKLQEEDDEARRRAFLAALGAAGSFLDPEHLAVALGAPRFVDRRVLDDLEFQGHQFGRLYWQLSPASFWPTLYGYTMVTRQMQRTAPGGLAVQASVIASRATTLLGMLAHRLHRRADAVASFRMADELAEEAGAGPLRAHALVALRAVYSPVTGGDVRTDARKAVTLLNEADDVAEASTPLVLRTWLHACRAEDYSLLGQPANAARDLEAAEQALARVSGQLDGFFHHWDASRLAGFRGNCHVLLRQPDEAIAVLEPVARNTSPDLIGPCTAVRCDLASAWAQRGEVERACQLLSEVLVMAQQVNAPERADRVRRIRGTRLAQWPDAPAVRQLDAQLQEFVMEG